MIRPSLIAACGTALALACAPIGQLRAQLSITSTGTNFTVDFDASVTNVNNGAWAGTGFEPGAPPTAGRMSSGAWAFTGWSNGNLAFGGTQITAATDYTRGATAVAQTTGGLYAFTNANIGSSSLGFQPGGSDWAPGTATLRVQNNTGLNITDLAVAYEVWIRNDQARGNSFNFSWSTDDLSYTPVGALDLVSAAAVDALGFQVNNRSTTITGLNVAPGGYIYLRWSGADVNGSGSRDEFALDDIVVNATGSPVPNTVVQFTTGSSTVSEGAGSTSLSVSITNPAAVQTTVDVVITAGSAARVNNYTTQTLIFPANDGSTQSQSITITDDGVYDGGGQVTFTLQNVTGGQGIPAIGSPSSHVLTITENEPPSLVINEVDYDNPGADVAEFVELKNTGAAAFDIGGFKLELVNGNLGGAAVYTTITLPSFTLAAGGYYVVGNNATIPNINLVIAPATFAPQNGSPDAVGLRDPSNTLIDAVSYEGNTGAPYTEGTGLATIDSDDATDGIGISRFPDGSDTQDNSIDWSRRCLSPGAANNSSQINCICTPPDVTVSTECIDDFTWRIVVVVNNTGSGSTVDITNDVNLDAVLGAGPGTYFIAGGGFANNAVVTLTVAHQTFSQCNVVFPGLTRNCLPDCNNVQGGPDVPGAPCDDGDGNTINDVWSPSCVCAGNLIQPIVGFIAPTATVAESGVALTVGLEMDIAPAGPVVVDVTDLLTGTATSGTDYSAIGTLQFTFLPTDVYPYLQTFNVLLTDDADYEPTETFNLSLSINSGTALPGTSTFVGVITSEDLPTLRINEVDYDNAGTDNAEWLELKNTGNAAFDIAGFSVQLVNGNLGGAAVYKTIILPSFTLAAGGYYVIGNNAAIPNLNLLQTPATDMIQNGSPDAIGLRDPFNTLIDAISYEGNTGAPYTETAGLPVAQFDDNVLASKVIARYLDGNDTDNNSVDWKVWCATPGASNATVDADSDGTPDCLDGCPADANKIAPGVCGCGVPDVPTTWYTDIDLDGFGDPSTGTPGFTCAPPLGSVQDNTDDCPTVFGKVGDSCNDNNPFTTGDVLNGACACVGTPVPCDNWTLTIDAGTDGSAISWQMVDANSPFVLDNGGPYTNGSSNAETICVPQGACFNLTFTDDADGIAGGGWKLVDNNGRRILDNVNNGGCFSGTSTTALPFCSEPVSAQTVIVTQCDKENWILSDVIIASAEPAVSAQWGIGDQTDDGYQFWFQSPCGGYSRQIFRNHATSGGQGPANALRATKLALSTMVTNPLPIGQLLNVRVRSRVNGVNGAWGPACRFKVDPAACTVTQLNNFIASPNYSCGVAGKSVGASGNAGKIFANVVTSGGVYATHYRFEFAVPGEGYLRNVVSTTAVCQLGVWQTNPLLCGTYTYEVRVQASFNGGVSYCPFGPVCTVGITNNQPAPYCTPTGESLAEQVDTRADAFDGGDFAMYPNPNDGDRLFLQMGRIADEVSTVSVDIYDAMGKRVSARTVPVADGAVNNVIELDHSMTDGLYFVTITAGSTVRTERLVIQ